MNAFLGAVRFENVVAEFLVHLYFLQAATGDFAFLDAFPAIAAAFAPFLRFPFAAGSFDAFFLNDRKFVGVASLRRVNSSVSITVVRFCSESFAASDRTLKKKWFSYSFCVVCFEDLQESSLRAPKQGSFGRDRFSWWFSWVHNEFLRFPVLICPHK